MIYNIINKLFWWVPAGKAPEITAEDVQALIEDKKNNFILVDVRTHKEWKRSHIKGAVNMPVTRLFSEYQDDIFNKDKLIIVICRSAHRSIAGYRFFRDKGFTDVVHLREGMRRWWSKNLPTDKLSRSVR